MQARWARERELPTEVSEHHTARPTRCSCLCSFIRCFPGKPFILITGILVCCGFSSCFWKFQIMLQGLEGGFLFFLIARASRGLDGPRAGLFHAAPGFTVEQGILVLVFFLHHQTRHQFQQLVCCDCRNITLPRQASRVLAVELLMPRGAVHWAARCCS